MTFIITGRESGRTVTQTRERAASAKVLAQKWSDRGVREVRIEAAGRSFDIAGFDKQFVLTRVGLRARPLAGV